MLTHVWKESDIEPGKYYFRHDGVTPFEENPGYYGSVLWKIGYLPNPQNELERYVSIAATDGMVTHAHTKRDMALMLTMNNYIPVPLEFLRKIQAHLSGHYSENPATTPSEQVTQKHGKLVGEISRIIHLVVQHEARREPGRLKRLNFQLAENIKAGLAAKIAELDWVSMDGSPDSEIVQLITDALMRRCDWLSRWKLKSYVDPDNAISRYEKYLEEEVYSFIESLEASPRAQRGPVL